MSDAKPLIVPLLPDDAEGLKGIALLCFPEKWTAADFLYFLNHDQRVAVGCRSADGKCLMAYFVGLLVQGDLDIISIATHPDFRGQGLGKRILESVLANSAVKRAFLEVRVSNQQAKKLYEASGFKLMGTRKKYYGGTEDALQLRWLRVKV